MTSSDCGDVMRRHSVSPARSDQDKEPYVETADAHAHESSWTAETDTDGHDPRNLAPHERANIVDTSDSCQIHSPDHVHAHEWAVSSAQSPRSPARAHDAPVASPVAANKGALSPSRDTLGSREEDMQPGEDVHTPAEFKVEDADQENRPANRMRAVTERCGPRASMMTDSDSDSRHVTCKLRGWTADSVCNKVCNRDEGQLVDRLQRVVDTMKKGGKEAFLAREQEKRRQDAEIETLKQELLAARTREHEAQDAVQHAHKAVEQACANSQQELDACRVRERELEDVKKQLLEALWSKDVEMQRIREESDERERAWGALIDSLAFIYVHAWMQ
jgi:hypothetical protein